MSGPCHIFCVRACDRHAHQATLEALIVLGALQSCKTRLLTFLFVCRPPAWSNSAPTKHISLKFYGGFFGSLSREIV